MALSKPIAERNGRKVDDRSVAGEKRTLRVPLTQHEPSDTGCLSLFIAWPALHTQ